MKRLLALAVAALLAPGAARAHDFWIEPSGDGYLVLHGHRGGALVPLDPAALAAIRCLDAHGAIAGPPPRPVADGPGVRIPARCAIVTATRDGGAWSLTPDGEVSRGRDEVPDALRSWESRQLAKWVDPRAAAATTPVGDALELIPPRDLASARAGDKATFRVLSDGVPVPGARVSIGHRAIGETDSRGEVRVKLRAAGVESVSASLRRTIASPRAEAAVLEASLTFEVGR